MMAIYHYVAKDLKSNKVRGKLEVQEESEVAQLLREQGLFLIRYRKQQEKDQSKRLKLPELSAFSQEIGTMLESGVSLIRAMSIMANAPDIKPSTKEIYKNLYVKLQQGKTLSTAMEEEGNAFPPLMVAMYRSGETSGKLADTAKIMARQYEKDFKLVNTVKTASTYPMILIVISILVIIIIFSYVLPQFFDTFSSMDTALPAITMIMLMISESMQKWWYLYILGVLIIVAIISGLLRNDAVRYQVDKMKLKSVKKVGNLLSIIYTARFARSLCSLYTSGMNMMNSLNIVKATVHNTYIEKQFDDVIKKVRNGTTLSSALAGVDGFSAKLSNSIYVGEESGKLEDMLLQLADDYDYQAEQATNKMVALLEPILIVTLGLVIGIILISVMLPIYTMYQSAGSI